MRRVSHVPDAADLGEGAVANVVKAVAVLRAGDGSPIRPEPPRASQFIAIVVSVFPQRAALKCRLRPAVQVVVTFTFGQFNRAGRVGKSVNSNTNFLGLTLLCYWLPSVN